MTAASPALASVVVMSLQDFARQPVTEQDRLKGKAEDLVARALRPLPPAQRIVLDAPYGVAVALLDHPRLALELAEQVQGGAGDLPLCIGIDHGPITIAEDANRGRGVVGDGITSGMILAGVATPGRLVASRSFREALLAEAPASAARLAPAGKHTDTQVRTHELYSLDPRAARSRRLRLAAVGALAFAGIMGLGVAGRMALQAGAAPAVIEFRVTPRGDVYVDGVLKGSSPPLTRLEIAPGPHSIEIRNSPHPPLKVEIDPGAAEEMTIAHSFASRSPAARASKGGTAKGDDKSLRESAREGWKSFRRGVGF